MAAGKRKLTAESSPRRGRGHTGGRRAAGRSAEVPTPADPARSTLPPPEPAVETTRPDVEPSAVVDDPPPSRARRPHGLDKPEVTELEIGSTVHRVVPDPKPLDVDGIRTMAVGSAIWLAALLALLPFLGTLQRNGQVWWLWTCLAGFGLGLIGVEYCRRRKAALEADGAGAVDDAESVS